MTFKERCVHIQELFDKVDVSNAKDNLSALVNITGEGGGTIFCAIANRKKALIFNPETQKKTDLQVTISGENLDLILEKKMDPIHAFTKGKIKIKGNIIKVFSLKKSISLK